jgi:hypothetical protein
MAMFRKNPFNPSELLSVDTLLTFTHFIDGVATLDGGVEVRDEGDEFRVIDQGREVAKVVGRILVMPPHALEDQVGSITSRSLLSIINLPCLCYKTLHLLSHSYHFFRSPSPQPPGARP